MHRDLPKACPPTPVGATHASPLRTLSPYNAPAMRKLRSALKSIWAINVQYAAVVLVSSLVILAVSLAWLLWPLVYNYIAPQTPADRKDIVVFVVQGIGVIGIAIGLIFTWLRLRAAERTIQISMEGQITERFTRAIQQLGDQKLPVCLGGIYALERIACDSPRDHWTIMEVLTAYVRMNVSYKSEQQVAKVQSNDSTPMPPTVWPPLEIQTILTVIGRRSEKARKSEPAPLDLSNTDLRRTRLPNARLERVQLWEVPLEDAFLVGCHLEFAFLRDSHLDYASLGNTHFENADLQNAHLPGAFLKDSWLGGANLSGADLQGAILHGAHLTNANLWGAHMKGAVLGGSHLEGADLRYATDLTREQLASAITDEHTILPDYLKDSGSKETSAGKPGT